MAFTQADVDRIDRAIANSELEVELDGRRVRFDSVDGLMKRRTIIATAVAATAAGSSVPTRAFRYTFTTSRGD